MQSPISVINVDEIMSDVANIVLKPKDERPVLGGRFYDVIGEVELVGRRIERRMNEDYTR